VIYTFFYVYCFGLIKPVMPIVNDVLAHTFYKMQHLASVHLENGKYHVHSELAAEADKQNNSAKGNRSVCFDEKLANHLLGKTIEYCGFKFLLTLHLFPNEQPLLDGFVQNLTPPPKA
jgi:hypothetical protein